MKRSYFTYLTLLWVVTAHEDHGRTRSLAGKLCTKRGGTVCLADHHANVEVDGDIALWKDTLGVSSQGSAACQIKSKMLLDLDTRTKRFCGEVDNMVHELRAPRFATDVVKAAGFRPGRCRRYGWGTPIAHSVRMTMPEDETDDPDDCFCNDGNDCYCRCDCDNTGAGIIEFTKIKGNVRLNNTDAEKKALRKKHRKRNNDNV